MKIEITKEQVEAALAMIEQLYKEGKIEAAQNLWCEVEQMVDIYEEMK